MRRSLEASSTRHVAGSRARISILLFLVTVAQSACGPRPKDCIGPDVHCAGLVTGFGTVAAGINRQAWLALEDAKSSQMLDRIDYIETVDSRDRAANIDFFAADRYDIIVTVGASIEDETAAAARQYPNLTFIGVEQSQETGLANYAGLVFHEEKSGFLVGALAALLTESGRIAAVCEERFIDSIRRYCDGFAAGAAYAKPEVQATVTYRTGPTDVLFHDSEWGRTTAIQQLEEGVDVLFATGGDTANAALEAAAARGAIVIGAETDLYEALEDVRPQLATSAVNDVRSGLLDLLRLALSSDLPGGEHAGPVGLAPFHEYASRIPPAVIDRIEEIRRQLDDGVVDIGVPYKSP